MQAFLADGQELILNYKSIDGGVTETDQNLCIGTMGVCQLFNYVQRLQHKYTSMMKNQIG